MTKPEAGREFDTAKGAFFLVAIIIVTQMLVSVTVTAFCVIGISERVIQMGGCRDVSERMMELFQMSFTAAIAFAGGRMSAPPPRGPTLPDERSPPK